VDAPFRPDVGDPDALYLMGGRFKVNVNWMNHHAPGNPTGVGHAVDGSDASGYFWFFNQINLELVVKMIDARSFDGSFWVFWGGLSDVQYEVEVEDLETGDTWQHTNPPGSICGGADTAAFEPLAG
jgi:hypothetical protein